MDSLVVLTVRRMTFYGGVTLCIPGLVSSLLILKTKRDTVTYRHLIELSRMEQLHPKLMKKWVLDIKRSYGVL